MKPKMLCLFCFLLLLGTIQVTTITRTALDHKIKSKLEIYMVAVSSGLNIVMLLILLSTKLAQEYQGKIRTVINALGAKVIDLSAQVSRIKTYASTLEEENKVLAKREVELSKLAESQKTNVDAIIRLLKESKEVQQKQMLAVAEVAKHAVSRATLDAFDSSNHKDYLDNRALYHLMLGVESLGYDIDRDEFEEKIRETDRSLLSMLELVSRIVDENVVMSSSLSSQPPTVSLRLRYWQIPDSPAMIKRKRTLSRIDPSNKKLSQVTLQNQNRGDIFSMEDLFVHYE